MKKRLIYLICGVVCLGIAVFFAAKVVWVTHSPAATRTAAAGPVETSTPSPVLTPTPSAEPTPTPTPEVTPEPTPEPTPTATPYVSPVDFEALWEVNPDIYAWLEIGDTDISYPIVQSPEDDTFYLDHNSDRVYSANGAVFSEATYNSGDLTDLEAMDPVTILYGHHMKDGAIFGNLQKYYSDVSFFEENPTFKVYTPEATLEYGVFAATPYSSQHILYANDFTDPEVFETFFESVFNVRELGANFNEEYAPEEGDKVMILSTCLIGNNTRRFLVMATLVE